MDIGVIGINYKTASVEEREALARVAKASFSDDESAPSWFQGILLSTCNRTEIYFSAEDLGFFHSRLLSTLRLQLSSSFEHQLYSYFGRDCFRHLASVASGLDSAILAENEIQRQVKVAYDQACLHFDLVPCLHFLFQKSLKLAKGVRTLAPLLQPRVGLQQLIYGLWRDFFRGINHLPILLVGNSQINRQILTHFKYKKVEAITLCTRSVSAVEESGIQVVDWSHLKEWPRYRLIICASSAPEPLLSMTDSLCSSLNEKTLILDLALPRNVCPSLKRHPSVHLLNIDELSLLLRRHKAHQIREVESWSRWIEAEVDKQVAIFRHKTERAVEYTL